MKFRLDARELCQPLPLAAVAVLLVNDHLLKGAGWLPGAVTGKLSDVAGLFFFPIFLFVLARSLFGGREGERGLAYLSAGATAVVFAALKLSPTLNALAERFWGVFVMDPTDLLCLPACALAVVWLERRGEHARSEGIAPSIQLAVVSVAAAASIATSPPPVRNFPHWEIEESFDAAVGSLELRAWTAKSGKEGLGVMVRATNPTRQPRRLVVDAATLELFRDDPERILKAVGAAAQPAQVVVEPQESSDIYLPFAFDNESAWNSEIRHAWLVLDVRVDGEEFRWRMPAAHVFEGFHRPYGGHGNIVKERQGESKDVE